MSYSQHPLIELADKHLDASLERLDKSTRIFWSGQSEWGRSVMTLSSGALVLSISVAQFLISKSAGTSWNALLPVAWVFLGVSLILSASHHTWLGAASLGRLHFEMKRSAIRSKLADLDMDAPDVSEKFDAVLAEAFKEAEVDTAGRLKTYNRRSQLMSWSLILGIGLLVAYTIRNLSL